MNSGRGIPEYRAPMSPRSELSTLINRVECMVLPGVIHEIDYKAGYARVAMRDKKNKGIITDWLRWTEHTAGDDREWCPPSVGELVLVLSPTGNLNAGIISGRANTTVYRPLSNSPTIRRKTWGKKKDDSFFDFPFWELEKEAGKEHVWDYLPKNGEFRKEIGDNVLIHYTPNFMMWRIGNTQIVLRDGLFRLTIADDLTTNQGLTEIVAKAGSLDLHVNGVTSVRINNEEVRAQSGPTSALIVGTSEVSLGTASNTALTMSATSATLEVLSAQAKLSLDAGVTVLSNSTGFCYLSPLITKLGLIGSEVLMTPADIALNTTILLIPIFEEGAVPGVGMTYTPGPLAPVVSTLVPEVPQAPDVRWTLEESEGPYYPRTGKPKE